MPETCKTDIFFIINIISFRRADRQLLKQSLIPIAVPVIRLLGDDIKGIPPQVGPIAVPRNRTVNANRHAAQSKFLKMLQPI